MALPLYVFDAYGTLFDVHSAVARHRDLIGPEADRLSQIWRAKQLEYTWVYSLMRQYRDFRRLTEDALDFAAAACGGLSPGARLSLLQAYDRLDAFGDVRPCLEALKAAGARTAILSNGTQSMLISAVQSAGLTDVLDECLSVEQVRAFKTAPEVYELVLERFGVPPSRVSFQSSNRWDIAGATAFGFRSVWINRTAQPDEYATHPPYFVRPNLVGLEDI